MRIAVVGAGIAGLSAARALQAAGHDVTVFERSPHPGGRVATWRARDVELNRGPQRAFPSALGWRRMGTADLEFDHGAQYFTVRDPRFAEVVAEWERRRVVARWTGRIVTFDGEGWEDVEAGTERFVGVPSMRALGGHLAEGLTIRYEVEVAALADLAGFDRVVVALPAPSAAPLLAGAPRLRERAAAIVMKPCWAVLTAFEEPVPTRFDAAFVASSPLGWIARNQSKPGRTSFETWVLHATMPWSEAHAADRPDAVSSFLLGAFADLVPKGIPRPCYVTAHRWRFAAPDPALAVGALHDSSSGVVACGDWCAGARIEDVYLSGVAAARLATT
jgi:hypothetical protein